MKQEVEISFEAKAGKESKPETAQSIYEMLSSVTELRKKIVMDICCSDGRLVRKIAETGSRVIGVDERDKIRRLRNLPAVAREKYAFGRPDDIPAPDNYCDLIIYNEVLYKYKDTLTAVLAESLRALKRKGKLVIIEPVFIPGSYSETVELIESRKDNCLEIYSKLKNSSSYAFDNTREKYFTVQKDFDDFVLRAEMTIRNFNTYTDLVKAGKRKFEELTRAINGRRKLPLHYRLNLLEKL